MQAALRKLLGDRRDVDIYLCGLKAMVNETRAMLKEMGFDRKQILSEKYDFGSSRTINSLFSDLLGVTPFSTKESKEYEEFLNDRNLLVHHGGIYTFKYHGQRLADKPISMISPIWAYTSFS